jgi:NAD(P)-dependent dehydrogenase (short-subunit alcohol dehydrogenase family)
MIIVIIAGGTFRGGSPCAKRERSIIPDLLGKVAVITGGATGIGLVTAKKFVAGGAHALVFGRRNAELDAAVKAIGGNVTAVRGDVTKLSDLDRLYSAVKAEKGKLDIVFAAAVAEIAGLEQVTEEQFDRHFDINVRGTVFNLAERSSTTRLGRLRHRDGIWLRY